MRKRTNSSLLPTLVTILLLGMLGAGCEQGSPTGIANSGPGLVPSFNTTGLVCETINFDGFAHGEQITSVQALGQTWTVSVLNPGSTSTGDAVAYDTNTDGGQDADLEVTGVCPACAGLNSVLILQEEPGTQGADDSDTGGTARLAAASSGSYFVTEFKALDQEVIEGLALDPDGNGIVAASSNLGDGTVETVDVNPDAGFSNFLDFIFTGSGAVDDIVVCEGAPGVGRMTGGGGYIGMVGAGGEEVRVTHGFTLHCDVELSNNLEVNWAGNKWHIEKEFFLPGFPICTDEPGVNPEPPPAPFDTFEGMTIGKLNGQDGSPIWFILQDAGEPGGKNDKGGMKIWDVGADPAVDAPILEVVFDFLGHGNIQAHYDQPHGCNVNKC